MISLFLSDTKISSTYYLLHFGKYKRHLQKGLSWPWSYGSWIYNYLCNECISPLMLWVQISIRARCTTLCDKVCQRLAIGRCFSPGPPFYSTNKSDRYDIAELSLKVALLNTIIYVNVCVKRVYPHKTNNNIQFRYGKIPESQFSVSSSSLRWSN